MVHPAGEAISRFSSVISSGDAFLEGDAARDVMQRVGHEHRTAEARDAQQRRAPIGDRAEVVDEPAQRRLDLGEGPGRHHQPAEGDAAAEVERRRDEDRRHDREPAIARGDPGQIGVGR